MPEPELRRLIGPQASDADEEEFPSLDLDKFWYELHQAMVGDEDPTEEPLSQALYGVRMDSHTEFSYALPSDISRIVAALDGADKGQVRQRAYDLLAGPNGEAGDENADSVMEDFRRLREFYGEAAAAGEAVLFMMF